jgi:hypothetical protein
VAIVAVGGGIALIAGLALYFLLRGASPAPLQATPALTPNAPVTAAKPPSEPTEEPTPPSAPGLTRVIIQVEPADATVRVNGRALPGRSPFVLPDVDTRWPLQVRAERQGYKPHEEPVPLTAPKTALSIKLEPLGDGAPADSTAPAPSLPRTPVPAAPAPAPPRRGPKPKPPAEEPVPLFRPRD